MTLPATPPTGNYTTVTCQENTYDVEAHDSLKAARAFLAEEMKWENTKCCMISDGAWEVAIEHNP